MTQAWEKERYKALCVRTCVRACVCERERLPSAVSLADDIFLIGQGMLALAEAGEWLHFQEKQSFT